MTGFSHAESEAKAVNSKVSLISIQGIRWEIRTMYTYTSKSLNKFHKTCMKFVIISMIW